MTIKRSTSAPTESRKLLDLKDLSGDEDPQLDQVLKTSRGSQVADSLRKAIITGQFRPGDELREEYLAKALGISRGSLRHGFQILAYEGLIVREASQVARVTQYTPEELMEAHELRLILEPRAMKLAHKKITPADERTLRDLVTKMEDSAKRELWYDHVRFDFQFHGTIWSIADCATLKRALEAIFYPLYSFLSLIHLDWMKKGTNLQDSIRIHGQFVDAIISGEPGLIEATVREVASLPGNAPQYLAFIRADGQGS